MLPIEMKTPHPQVGLNTKYVSLGFSFVVYYFTLHSHDISAFFISGNNFKYYHNLATFIFNICLIKSSKDVSHFDKPSLLGIPNLESLNRVLDVDILCLSNV